MPKIRARAYKFLTVAFNIKKTSKDLEIQYRLFLEPVQIPYNALQLYANT